MDRPLLDDFEGMRDGTAAFFSQDAPYYMKMIFRMFETKDYSELTTFWEVVGKNLGISSCCVFSPLLNNHQTHMERRGVPRNP